MKEQDERRKIHQRASCLPNEPYGAAKKDPNHRVIMHTHPTRTLAMTHIHELKAAAEAFGLTTEKTSGICDVPKITNEEIVYMKLTAKWITAPEDPGQGAVTYRRSFSIQKTVKKATLNASAMGIYDPRLNGQL